MAQIDVYNQNAEVVKQVELNDAVFAIEPNQQVFVRAHIPPRQDTSYPDPARSRSVRRAQAVPVRVPRELLSGDMVRSLSDRIRESITSR